MKLNGILILSSPNLRSLGGIKNLLFYNKSSYGKIYPAYKKLDTLDHMGHVRIYTTKEVIEFLQKIGFKITGVIYRGIYKKILAQVLIRSIPCLSPHVSYIASKPLIKQLIRIKSRILQL